MIYIASPYTHADPRIQTRRALLVREYAYELAMKGIMCYSPIVYGHQFNRDYIHDQIPYEYWISHGLHMLELCSAMHVYKLFGWEKSEGVVSELNHAGRCAIPVEYIDAPL